ncbi:hypothetical protein CEXT_29061 [Caerostris extrusa]|uniref:Uncharacterized protein n=1 Tax=Caerostris extrusa TaxID=172846 RepID=A0AAV4VLR8_CAEEX|nr:hypothetical protein CEXT_29061 [Caerostris extrusa]
MWCLIFITSLQTTLYSTFSAKPRGGLAFKKKILLVWENTRPIYLFSESMKQASLAGESNEQGTFIPGGRRPTDQKTERTRKERIKAGPKIALSIASGFALGTNAICDQFRGSSAD